MPLSYLFTETFEVWTRVVTRVKPSALGHVFVLISFEIKYVWPGALSLITAIWCSLLEYDKQKTWPSAQAETEALTLVTTLDVT